MKTEIFNTKVWLIMSKDRKLVAKGTPRNRELIRVNDGKDKKRFLTYSSKGRAESAFRDNGFFGRWLIDGYEWGDPLDKYLEAVECEMSIVAL